MAILKIVTDQEFLRQKSKPVTEFNARLHTMLDDMADTMLSARGIGIAAPQIGVLWRVCLVVTSDGVLELINPEIITNSRNKSGEEKCLSIPGKDGLVTVLMKRPTRLLIKAQDRFGNFFERELKGLPAVCAGHEIDHLDGVLIIDRGEIVEDE